MARVLEVKDTMQKGKNQNKNYYHKYSVLIKIRTFERLKWFPWYLAQDLAHCDLLNLTDHPVVNKV